MDALLSIRSYASLAVAALLLMAGCSPLLQVRAAKEVSRDKLLAISERGHADHLQYVGTEGGYHYVVDTRPESGRSYKVRSDQLKLEETFRLDNEENDKYVLHPWLIEGTKLGSKPAPLPKRSSKGIKMPGEAEAPADDF